MRGFLWSATIASLLICAGCNDGGLPTRPSPQPLPPPAPFVPAPGSNGSFTLLAIIASRPLCPQLTSQIGMTWSLWVAMDTDGDAVTLTLSESPLPPGPFDDPPARYKGVREGNVIVASRIGPMGGMACPLDLAITPQVGGDLTATISGNQIAGEFRETFGTGADAVTWVSRFQATLPE